MLLHVTNDAGRQTWITDPVVVRDAQNPAATVAATTPGVAYRYQSHSGSANPDEKTTGTATSLALSAVPHGAQDYSVAYSTDLNVPEDGGYVFTVIANDESSIAVDGKPLGTSPKPFAQVCGLAGNAARPITVATELAKGLHHLEVSESHGAGVDNFQVLWQGPGILLQPIPAERLSQP